MRTRPTFALAVTAAAALPLACAPEPQPLDGRVVADLGALVALADNEEPQGIAYDAAKGTALVIVERRGVLELGADGALVGEKRVGDNGLEDRPYRDLAVAGEGRTVFIADGEGYLWDEVTGRFSIHFCVEPGFIECTDENGELVDENNNGICDWEEDQPEPQPEPIVELVQKNDALAVVGQTILAAPRFYEPEQLAEPVEASLRSYDLATGASVGAIDLTGSGLELGGLASTTSDAAALSFVGVSDERLVVLDEAGALEHAYDLGTTDAAGVAIVGDELFVLDRDSKRVIAVELP